MQILDNKNNMLILDNGDFIDFISYTTHIARYHKPKQILALNENYWDYSQTTLKQLKSFINLYTNFKYITKKDFETEIKINNKIKLVACFR